MLLGLELQVDSFQVTLVFALVGGHGQLARQMTTEEYDDLSDLSDEDECLLPSGELTDEKVLIRRSVKPTINNKIKQLRQTRRVSRVILLVGIVSRVILLVGIVSRVMLLVGIVSRVILLVGIVSRVILLSDIAKINYFFNFFFFQTATSIILEKENGYRTVNLKKD